MKARAEVIAAAAFLAASLGYLLYDTQYAIGTLASPGPAVFPLVVGVAAAALAAYELWEALAKWRACVVDGDAADTAALSECADSYDERRPAFLVLAMVGYLLLVETVGFFTCTAALVVVCSRLMGARDWLRPAVLGVGLAVGCYLLFEVWLRLSLPAGFLI
jgi:putative tricarboxylic transport membrane protein